ncbi:MAG: FecR family protein [Bacteroidetes bacterium]|nr:FecR family protein [Bacteroidota bacterium]
MTKYSNYKFKDFISDETFCNYARGLNKCDEKAWEAWMNKNPENKDIAEEAKTQIQLINFKKKSLPEFFIHNEWNKLSSKIDFNKKESILKHNKTFNIKVWRNVAAIFIFFFALSIFFVNKTFLNQENTCQKIIVPKGQIKKIILPDNSIVVINSGTELRYSENFGEKNRDVFLYGEAYFDVTHNSSKPFIVHTCENTVKVVGTAFNISAFPDEDIHRISLERGKIELAKNGESFSSLSPNQIYLLVRKSKQAKVFKSQNIKMYSSWKEGSIRFVNQTFFDITTKLERSHNINFNIKNKKIKNCRYTGEFSRMQNIESILKIIKLTTPFNYEIKNDTIIIK